MEITVTFIGNATTLISAGGVTLLTDPNFPDQGQHASRVRVFASPLSDFTDEMRARGLADRIIELERGGSITV